MTTARRILHFDAVQGASGDMILGALVGAGARLEELRTLLQRLPLRGFEVSARSIERCGMRMTQVDVHVEDDAPSRDLGEIERIVAAGGLPAPVTSRAQRIFRRLFEAEAEVHGRPVEQVHLHEAGGTDAIVDVVGASIGLALLEVERIVVSAMTTGFGEIRCAHGVYPVPAPATLVLARGAPIRGGDIEAERLTPTGAAILTTLADAWGALPPMRPFAIGCGAGSRELPGVPNVLRATLGESTELPGAGREVAVIECSVDDSTPQAVAHAVERLFDAGALDATTTAVAMKKGRLGHHITVLARPERLDALVDVLLRETSTLGVRYRREGRVELERSVVSVPTRYGEVALKVGRLGDGTLRAWPEYERCAELAANTGVPLQEVQLAALEAFRARR